MSHTDPIADMLTRIRNAIMAEHKSVNIPLSKIKREIANVLKREGYITDYRVEKSHFPPRILIDLKYKTPKENAIVGIQRVSKPGRRVYAAVDNIPKVLGGLGVALLSTSKGILTGRECERHNIGGEVLLYVW
ncbi:MAG: 30S ribosomal protein S8 [Candidatus Aminicenantes bacterium]|nr:30S ribosomal protein S8 [Candidatus Aminicenantes bacterium]NIM81539.1 30S ribosomal protein S8 [Candidatus Aminicenantes bacterium]NIN20910.1 30S ribosomal protein S8 [Candidatus Aminicenantes bacterium]NIN44731.1 30S ribosomal protein S8 [Candidatus Aminicenantes bacterium]NIN87539.1 30S ribosomal protein S8 [Candidatus Aminicenantes bacterium]